MNKYDVVQFNENHQWCGAIGYVNEISDVKIMVGVIAPKQGTAYVYATEKDLEYIGKMVLVPNGGNDE